MHCTPLHGFNLCFRIKETFWGEPFVCSFFPLNCDATNSHCWCFVVAKEKLKGSFFEIVNKGSWFFLSLFLSPLSSCKWMTRRMTWHFFRTVLGIRSKEVASLFWLHFFFSSLSLSLSSKNFGAIFAARPGVDSTKTWKCSKTSMLTYVLLVILYYYLLYSKLRLHQMKYTLICSIFQPLIILQVGKFHRITISCWRSWKSHLRVSAFINTFTRAAPD